MLEANFKRKHTRITKVSNQTHALENGIIKKDEVQEIQKRHPQESQKNYTNPKDHKIVLSQKTTGKQ
jgi:hypothetical protein